MRCSSTRIGVVALAVVLLSGGLVAGGVGLWSSPVSADECAIPADPITASPSEARELLVGTWISCTGASAVPPLVDHGAVGLQFADDGRWYRVYRADDGTLIRPGGLDHEGTWDVDDSTGQLNVYERGQFILRPTFFATPSMVQLETSMTFETFDYRRSDEADPVPGVPPGVGTGPCGLPTGFVTPASTDEAEELLTGTWIRCSGDPIFPATDDHEVGLQFTADGHWYRVYRAEDGTLIRAEGLDQDGTYAIAYVSDTNVQLDLRTHDGRTHIANPVYLESPPFLRLGWGPGASDHLLWTGPEPAPGEPPGSDDWPCGNPSVPVALSSVEQAEDLLVGVWLRCQGSASTLGSTPGAPDVGLQFTADGSWYYVFDGPGDTLVRTLQGSWRITEDSAVAGHFYVTVGGLGFQPTFSTDPPLLRVDSMIGMSDHLRWTGPEPVDGLPPVDELPPADDVLPPTGAPILPITLLAGLAVVVGLTVTRLSSRRPSLR